MIEQHPHLSKQVRDDVEIHGQRQVDLDRNRWEFYSSALARRDIMNAFATPWGHAWWMVASVWI